MQYVESVLKSFASWHNFFFLDRNSDRHFFNVNLATRVQWRSLDRGRCQWSVTSFWGSHWLYSLWQILLASASVCAIRFTITRFFNVFIKRLLFSKLNNDEIQLTTQEARAIWKNERLKRSSTRSGTQSGTRSGTRPGTRSGTRSDQQQITISAACHTEMPSFKLASREIKSKNSWYVFAAISRAVSFKMMWNKYIDNSDNRISALKLT